MADWSQTKLKDSPFLRLRTANSTLLNNLKQGQMEIRSILKDLQSQKPALSHLDRDNHDTSFTVRGLDRTPTTVQLTSKTKDYFRKSETSTPKSYRDALVGPGNDRRTRGFEMTPNSILRNSTKNKSKLVRDSLQKI